MIIAFCVEKGGAGKSATSVAVSVEYVLRGFKTLLVDVDPQHSSLDWHRLAIANENPAPRVLAAGEGFEDDLLSLAANYDRVIIDAPGRYGRIMAGALAVADLFVMPTVPGRYDLWSTIKTNKLAERAAMQRPDLKIRAMLNKVDRRRSISREIRPALEGRGIDVLSSELSLLADFDEGIEEGLAPSNLNPTGKAAKEIRNLCDELDELGKELRHAI